MTQEPFAIADATTSLVQNRVIALQKGAHRSTYRAVVFEAYKADERISGGLFILADGDGKKHAPLGGSRRFEDQLAAPAYLRQECRECPF